MNLDGCTLVWGSVVFARRRHIHRAGETHSLCRHAWVDDPASLIPYDPAWRGRVCLMCDRAAFGKRQEILRLREREVDGWHVENIDGLVSITPPSGQPVALNSWRARKLAVKILREADA